MNKRMREITKQIEDDIAYCKKKTFTIVVIDIDDISYLFHQIKKLEGENGRLTEQLRVWAIKAGYAQAKVHKLEAEIAHLRGETDKYNELIMEVSCKYPGESRHETALRYIKNAEGICQIGESPDEELKRIPGLVKNVRKRYDSLVKAGKIIP